MCVWQKCPWFIYFGDIMTFKVSTEPVYVSYIVKNRAEKFWKEKVNTFITITIISIVLLFTKFNVAHDAIQIH